MSSMPTPLRSSTSFAAPVMALTAFLKTSLPSIFRKWIRSFTELIVAGWRQPPPGMARMFALPPSLPSRVASTPRESARCCNTAAPAPSPKSTQVLRSFQSMIEDNFSAPMISTFWYVPLSINWRPISSAYRKPVQAASRSNAAALAAPSSCCTMQAVAGKGMSGVMVATMIKSRSAASTPARSSAMRAAAMPMVEVYSSSAAVRRSRMPVREVIQSSVVSTIFSRSALVRTRLGT